MQDLNSQWVGEWYSWKKEPSIESTCHKISAVPNCSTFLKEWSRPSRTFQTRTSNYLHFSYPQNLPLVTHCCLQINSPHPSLSCSLRSPLFSWTVSGFYSLCSSPLRGCPLSPSLAPSPSFLFFSPLVFESQPLPPCALHWMPAQAVLRVPNRLSLHSHFGAPPCTQADPAEGSNGGTRAQALGEAQVPHQTLQSLTTVINSERGKTKVLQQN